MASRSLGTLTVDLIAKFGGFTQGMTRAEREADKKTREMQKKMTQRARAIDDAFSGMANTIKTSMLGLGVSVAAGVAGMVSMARDTARLSDEVQRFSTLSNTTTSDFQRLAFGANTVGVSTEKLADIFKDVQDKAGDFAQTGGGGMADFFENIAPRVGVTIEQFRRLSGPEALQLYVSSLEKANLSQQDMTFYMEAIASDSALLLPLLRNNGSAWRELGDDAQRYGAVLSDDVIAASKAYKDETAKLEAAMQGVRNEVGGQLLPVLSEFNAFMSDPATLQAIREMTGLLGGWAKAAAEAAQVVNNSSFWGWLQVGKDDAQDVDAAIVETEKKIKSLQSTVASMSRPLHKFWNADDIVIAEGQIGTLQSKLESLYSMRDKRNTSVVDQLDALGRVGLDSYPSTNPNAPFSPVTPPKGPRGKSQAEKDQEAAERFLQSMRDQVQKSQERTAWEQLHYDIQAKGLKLTDEQLAKAQGLATLMDLKAEAAQKLSVDLDRQNTLYQLQERLMNAQQQHQLELLTYGMGDQAAAELRERMALEQKQQAELRQMQHEHGQELRAAESADQKQRLQAMFDERYRLTQEAFAKELGLYDDAVKQKQAKERDWIAGAKAGMDTYVRDASNGYEATKQLAQNTFRSAEDAAVQFATTGKASASDLFSTIVQGLIRIQIQEAMTKMFGGSNGGVLGSLINTGLSWLTGGASATSGAGQYSLTSGGSGGLGLKLPGRATGGPVSAGGMYEVNERGMPELLKVGGKQVLLMAGQSGYVTPLAWQGGGAAGQAAASVGRGLAPMEVNVHNYAGAKVEQRQRSGPDGKVILDLFINEAAAQVAGDYGPMGQAMRQRGRIGG
jgi:lambda family phage tail tape measure protein